MPLMRKTKRKPKLNCNNLEGSIVPPLSLSKVKVGCNKSQSNHKSSVTDGDKSVEGHEFSENKDAERSFSKVFSKCESIDKKNIPISPEINVSLKSVQVRKGNFISYPLKESNVYNSSSINLIKAEYNASLANNSHLGSSSVSRIDSLCRSFDVDSGESKKDAQSTDDEFEFIFEQELIKEQIKRNVSLTDTDDYINSLVKGFSSKATQEEQEKLITKAIKTNRKLASFCVSLEAALVKELDTITKDVQNLSFHCSNYLDDADVMTSRGFYSQFGAPYFKDSSGFYCPRNQDFSFKLSKNQFIGYLYMQADHTADIAALSNAIREYIVDVYVKKSHLEDLKKTFSTVEDQVQRDMLKKKINFINSKVSFMKNVNLKYLAKYIFDFDIDWMKVSSKESLDILTPGECRRYWNLLLSPKVNRGTWVPLEKKNLKKFAMQCNYQNWEKIAELINTKRTGYQCFIQYKKNFGMLDFNRGRWSKKEDVQLSYLVSISEQGGVIGWAKVLCHLEGRTMAQALNRWYRLDPGLKKGKFTDEEDIILVNAVEQFGLDFQKVASVFPNRSAIQLRERYFAKRDMKVNKCGEWSLAEDKLLMDLIAVHGEKKWSKIAQNFPSRNRIQIRHRYKCIKLNLQKDPEFKLENLNRFKRNTHVNAKNKRDEEAISKSTAIGIISKTIEEGKIFYNKRRILKRTSRMKEKS